MIARCVPAFVCALLALAPIARAQDVEPQTAADADLARVRELARQGSEAMMDERWEDAYDALRSAYDLAPLPQVLMNLAGAELQTDRIRAAIAHYEAFLRAASADPALAPLLPSAREALASARERLGTLHIERTRVIEGDVVRLDGAPIHAPIDDGVWEVDPGDRSVAVVRRGEEIASARALVPRGGLVTVTLDVPPLAAVERSGVLPPPAPAPSRDTDDGSLLESPWLWAAVVLAIGAGVAVTAILLGRDGTETPMGNAMPGRIVLD